MQTEKTQECHENRENQRRGTRVRRLERVNVPPNTFRRRFLQATQPNKQCQSTEEWTNEWGLQRFLVTALAGYGEGRHNASAVVM